MFRKLMSASLAAVALLHVLSPLGKAGPVCGAIEGHKDRAEAHSTDVYHVACRAYETVFVHVRGDGDTDLDLYVYDENNNLIASDCDWTDNCVVRFTPRWTGKFKIKIVNLGSVYNRYTMTVR